MQRTGFRHARDQTGRQSRIVIFGLSFSARSSERIGLGTRYLSDQRLLLSE